MTMTSAPAARFPTVRIETHGCKLNMADSQRLARAFIEAGFAVAPAEDDSDGPADVYVLNSCTITNVADRKARRALSAARRAHPSAVIVASGCFAERSASAAAALEAVDLVVTNRDKPRLVEQVAARLGIDPVAPGGVGATPSRQPLLGRTRAFIKIQEGCDQVCAFCIVPRVRGRERSVPVGDLVDQVRAAAREGLQEVVLTGTQLGTYGFDLQPATLRGLLMTLLAETEIARVRVSSLQPPEMTDGLLDLWSGVGRGRLCPHFHMPLQSGSDRVLARMRRRYTASQYLEAVQRARQAAPGAAITADVIAGFPGETDDDFTATVDVMRIARLAGAHVFPYSARPGTSAAWFPEQIPAEIRRERAARLREVAEAEAATYRLGLVGEVRPVLWETAAPRLSGLTDNYVRVELGEGVAGHAARAWSRVNRIEAARLVGLDGDRMIGLPARTD
jgi:threonylcarbamoyladenosine tRNA methylthiotransferase MtaB